MSQANPVFSKIQKLLRLADAARNSSEAEATAAALKVQELLQEHGLTLAQIEAAGGESDGAPRTKQMLDRRARYDYQIKLMRHLAQNNFCMHLTRVVRNEKALYSGGRGKTSRNHLLVGRQMNVDVTISTYDYLIETITRLRNEAGYTGVTTDARNFMDGAVARITERLDEQRRAATKDKPAPAAANGSHRELVLADVYGSEEDLNNDALYGFPAGTTATRKAEAKRKQDEQAAHWKELQEQGVEKWEAWYLAHGYGTEDAKFLGSKFNKRQRRGGGRGYRGGHWTQGDEKHAQKVNSASYKAGRAAGDSIGLNSQVGAASRKRIGG